MMKKQLEENHWKRSISNQIILGLLANFSTIAPSMSIGFSAITIPVLEKELSKSQISWFASIASLATPVGCIFSGPFADRFGRKLAISLVNIVCFIGWICIAGAFYTSNSFVLLIFGRIFTGLSTGLCSSPATIYMAEIASSSLRGVFTVWATLFFSFGVLVIYFLGFLLKENLLLISLLTATLPCIGILITMFYIPESPMWLLCKNRIAEARLNMYQIFGSSEEYNATIESEIESLLETNGKVIITQQESTSKQFTSKVKYLLQPYILKPFMIIITFFFFQQFSGIFVILFYAVDIVKNAQITFDAYTTIVIIALVRLLACFVASIASKKFGKRPLSMISGIFVAISLLALVVFMYMKENGMIISDTTTLVPYFLIMFYFFTSCLGFLPFPFALSAEMFPTQIKGVAAGLCSGLGYVFNFAAVKMYPLMAEVLGTKGVFCFYGLIALLGTIFLFWFLPETRGRSVDEILSHFGMKENDDEKCEKEKIDI